MFQMYYVFTNGFFRHMIQYNLTYSHILVLTSKDNFVRVFEVGPRDGLQNEKDSRFQHRSKSNSSTDLSRTGLKYIEVTSFVSPKWVPQMSDHVEVLAAIDRTQPNVCYSGLTLLMCRESTKPFPWEPKV